MGSDERWRSSKLPRRAVALACLGAVVLSASAVCPGDQTFAADPAMHFELVETLPGRIVDVTQDQILWVDLSVDPSQIKIEDRGTGNQTILEEGGVASGFLVPGGAIYGRDASGPISGRATLIQYKDGVATDLGLMNSDFSLVTAGRWAIWNTDFGGFAGDTSLFARDLLTGQQRLVTENAGNWQNDVAENGDIVFWDRQYNIVRDRDGQQDVLSTATATEWATYPRTDGINVIYRRHSPCCFNDSGGIWLTTAGGEVDLDAFRNAWPNEDRDYAVNDGWAAFTRATASGGLTMWSRDPGGLIEPRSPGVETQIGVLGQGGQMLMYERTSGFDRIYLSRAGDEMIDLGVLAHTAFWSIGTDWYAADFDVAEYGRTERVFNRLYVVAPGPAPTPSPSPVPTPSASPTPAPTGDSSPALDVTLPPTDRTPAGNQGSGSPSAPALIAVIAMTALLLLAASGRRKAPRQHRDRYASRDS